MRENVYLVTPARKRVLNIYIYIYMSGHWPNG